MKVSEGDQGVRSVWVGPTTCDFERERRTATTLAVWLELAQNPLIPIGYAHAVIGNAIDLFRESLSCYQNGAFMACTLMCRCATETALYLAVSRNPSQITPPTGINVDHQNLSEWGQIRDKALDMKIIAQSDLTTLRELRDRGNFTAHYGQKFDQRIRSNTSSSDGLRLWAEDSEAEDSLRKVVSILSRVATWIGSSAK